MKKALTLILAVLMLFGCMSITAFAEDNTTDITAIVPDKTLSYDMVIPTSTTLTEEAHENVLLGTDGKVTIANVVNGTDKVNVSYTVGLTNGNLTDGTNTIDATYKYKQSESEFAAIDSETKVTVYANKTVTDSFVNVTADDTQWDNAPAGTYNASVTFNFVKEDVKTVTAADALVTGAEFKMTINYPSGYVKTIAFKKTADGFSTLEGTRSASLNGSDTINIDDHENVIAIYTENNTYSYVQLYQRVDFIFSVKPAGATEFVEVTLTEATPG